jgi:hypothetical protein
VTRPEPVRLDDLADPRFPDEIVPMREAMASMAPALKLEPDALLEAAVTATGLDDFGDGAFRERLEVLCAALRTEAGLSPVGVVMAFGQISQILQNRLLVEDLLRRHPEIHDVEIARPIVICGLPRTGTTHLHNLISADPALRSLPYWESLEPVLHERERGAVPDPRLARCEMALGFVNMSMPYFVRMHEMTVDHVHEEIQLLALDLSTMLFETMSAMPSWREYYKSQDQTRSYAYMKTALKALQWLRGGTRWVLKSPQHLEQFRPLVTTFPDATFVVTHRDPVSITASMATMIAYAARLNHATVDPVRFGRYWAERVEDLLRACAQDRDLLPSARSIDVRFDEFMADDIGMVRRIYDIAGQPMTADALAGMRAFMDAHPRGRHGTVVYDMDTLGLDRDERRAALKFYVDRFGIAEE